jgi:hypothetical protein
VHVGVERARRGGLRCVAVSADSGINGQISEPEKGRPRIVRTSPVVPNE